MKIKEQVIAKVTSFPTLPAMAGKLLNLLNRPEVSIAEASEVIKYDPALTANLMKAANSAYLGSSQSVSSMTEAVFKLGSKWVYQVAISSLIYSNLKKPVNGYNLPGGDLWRHSMAVALMSDILGKQLGIKDNGLVYTAGLLHDMGKMILGEFVSDSFDKIVRLVKEDNIPFEEAERQVLGIDHAEIGGITAESWNFPPEIVECVRWHHNPDGLENPSQATDIVHLADAICIMQGYGIGSDDIHYHPSDKSIARLKLTNTNLELATSQLAVSLEDIENIVEQKTHAKEEVGRS